MYACLRLYIKLTNSIETDGLAAIRQHISNMHGLFKKGTLKSLRFLVSD